MLKLPNYAWVIIGVCGALTAVAALFKFGYSVAETKYQKIIAEQQVKIKDLENREAKVEKEVVIEYKDRVQTITKIQEKIVEVTKNVLSEETNSCTIGPGFIGLHNAAAIGETVPRSSEGIDGASTKVEDSAGKD